MNMVSFRINDLACFEIWNGSVKQAKKIQYAIYNILTFL